VIQGISTDAGIGVEIEIETMIVVIEIGTTAIEIGTDAIAAKTRTRHDGRVQETDGHVLQEIEFLKMEKMIAQGKLQILRVLKVLLQALRQLLLLLKPQFQHLQQLHYKLLLDYRLLQLLQVLPTLPEHLGQTVLLELLLL
jgi:hypothetical protein